MTGLIPWFNHSLSRVTAISNTIAGSGNVYSGLPYVDSIISVSQGMHSKGLLISLNRVLKSPVYNIFSPVSNDCIRVWADPRQCPAG